MFRQRRYSLGRSKKSENRKGASGERKGKRVRDQKARETNGVNIRILKHLGILKEGEYPRF